LERNVVVADIVFVVVGIDVVVVVVGIIVFVGVNYEETIA
jgi:hypothetical protein